MDQQPEQPIQKATTQNVQPADAPVSQPAKQNIGQDLTTAEVQPLTPSTPAQALPPAGNSKKKLMLALGIFFIALFLIGSIAYLNGIINRTKRLGAYQAQPINMEKYEQKSQKEKQPELSIEEQEAASVDTGDPKEDLRDLDLEFKNLVGN